jgi:hypothetical protein
MRQIKLVVLGVAGLVAVWIPGCSSTGGYQTPEYRLSNGSIIELTQTLRFPTDGTRTYIQGGAPKAWNELTTWAPYCSFGLNTTRDHKPLVSEIHPTKFTTGDTRLGSYAALDPDNPSSLDPDNPSSLDPDSIFASRGIEVVADAADSAASPHTFYTTITLYSDQEPQVDDLTCAINGLPSARNLTLAQIQATLGSIVKMQ